MKIKIQVTREDIKHGVRKSSRSCPIARAIQREGWIPVAGAAVVSATCEKTGKFYQVPTPIQLREFMLVFDMYGSGFVQPFDYELEMKEGEH